MPPDNPHEQTPHYRRTFSRDDMKEAEAKAAETAMLHALLESLGRDFGHVRQRVDEMHKRQEESQVDRIETKNLAQQSLNTAKEAAAAARQASSAASETAQSCTATTQMLANHIQNHPPTAASQKALEKKENTIMRTVVANVITSIATLATLGGLAYYVAKIGQ